MTGFLDLMGSAFPKARTLLKALSDIFSLLMMVLRGTLALHRSTATLFSLFLEVFVFTASFFYLLESVIYLLLHKQLPNKTFLSSKSSLAAVHNLL
jgi:hypothetical protein